MVRALSVAAGLWAGVAGLGASSCRPEPADKYGGPAMKPDPPPAKPKYGGPPLDTAPPTPPTASASASAPPAPTGSLGNVQPIGSGLDGVRVSGKYGGPDRGL